MKLLILLIFVFSGECRNCSSNEKCVPQQECPSFQTEKAKLKEIKDNFGKENEDFLQLLITLQDMVCDVGENKVCCEDSNAVKRNCTSKALIMTGGYKDRNRLSSVEVYHPGTNTSCTLPSLPEAISHHTQDGLTQCGGLSCFTLKTDTAQWTKTHNLSQERSIHSSWRRKDQTILLIGGGSSPNTTELVSSSTGISTPEFTLKYETKWACSITDTSSVVITGGGYSPNPSSHVTRYNGTSWVEDLPSLLTARFDHGCALYTTETEDKVYVVMGGWDGRKASSTTETLQLGDSAWRESTALPRPVTSLRAATLDNIIYITEALSGCSGFCDKIYRLDTDSSNWVEVARMKTPRRYHGLSVIKYSEVEGLCTEE